MQQLPVVSFPSRNLAQCKPLIPKPSVQHPAMRRAFKDLKASKDPQVTTFCLSNSNEIYIKTILEVCRHSSLACGPPCLTLLCGRIIQHYNVTDVFDEVVTNPAQFNSDGLLELRRRVDPNGPQHSCKVGCSPNMCKGAFCHSPPFLGSDILPERN